MDSEDMKQHRKPIQQWTKDEDTKLLNAVKKFGTDDWTTIAQIVGGSRTRQQCHQRWFRVIDPSISRKTWSEEEERLLLKLIEEEGNRAWTKIAKKIGTRNDVQCRYHYNQILKKRASETENLDVKKIILEKIHVHKEKPPVATEPPSPNEIKEKEKDLDSKLSEIFGRLPFNVDQEWGFEYY